MTAPLDELRMIITIHHRVELCGENAYLHEQINDYTHFRYGPMPRDFVGPLMDERREFFKDMQRRYNRIRPIDYYSE